MNQDHMPMGSESTPSREDHMPMGSESIPTREEGQTFPEASRRSKTESLRRSIRTDEETIETLTQELLFLSSQAFRSTGTDEAKAKHVLLHNEKKQQGDTNTFEQYVRNERLNIKAQINDLEIRIRSAQTELQNCSAERKEN